MRLSVAQNARCHPEERLVQRLVELEELLVVLPRECAGLPDEELLQLLATSRVLMAPGRAPHRPDLQMQPHEAAFEIGADANRRDIQLGEHPLDLTDQPLLRIDDEIGEQLRQRLRAIQQNGRAGTHGE